jgi:hypothetical protein
MGGQAKVQNRVNHKKGGNDGPGWLAYSLSWGLAEPEDEEEERDMQGDE